MKIGSVDFKTTFAIGAAALLAGALGLGQGGALAQPAGDAQKYPQRPVRLVVPNLPGSATDHVGRQVAQRLTDAWGQQVIVDNRAGASGVIGHDIVARANPDGYTLMLSTSAGLVIVPIVNKVPYDPYRDFSPVSLVVLSPQMLVAHPSVAATNVNELLALGRAKPGQLNCASPGNYTSNHLGCEMLMSMGKVKFLHVPYKGASLAITDVVGGQVQFMFNSMPAVWPLAKAGKLRALAHGGVKRSPAAPDVPTVAESLPGFQCATWYSMIAPHGVPPAIISKVNAELVKMLSDPSFSKRMVDQGQEPKATTPAELAAFMRAEGERWRGVLKAAGFLSGRK
jgi:tripartite-type tricarboxylate transporter receptor subunit TctC